MVAISCLVFLSITHAGKLLHKEKGCCAGLKIVLGKILHRHCALIEELLLLSLLMKRTLIPIYYISTKNLFIYFSLAPKKCYFTR